MTLGPGPGPDPGPDPDLTPTPTLTRTPYTPEPLYVTYEEMSITPAVSNLDAPITP